MKAIKLVWLCVPLFCCKFALSQAVYEDERYVPEKDALVLERLEGWQDLKFGLLMHWGAYSQWGSVESWSICPEDYPWCARTKGSNPKDYNTYKKEYEDLQKTFNPKKFEPEVWAKAAQNAGMKYVVFTTKHHDGFCMFDSKYTDYKITSPNTPFSKNPKSNVTYEVFKSFRDRGLWIGAYFSKPDWHSPHYWDPYFPPKDRNVNYNPEEYPEKWKAFTEFTHNQVMELMTDYGKVDILWLDGGWVSKKSLTEVKDYYSGFMNKSEKTFYLKSDEINQDILMDDLVYKARKKQPGLIVVDRAVYGKNQNYLTPENRIPDKPLPYPWESCIIAGGGWAYTFDGKYMSYQEVIHTLLEIVAKGGNLLLNIAPSPEGEWDDAAYKLLSSVGAWLKVNGEAVYGTRAIAPYTEGNMGFVSKKDGTTYVYYFVKKGEAIPSKLKIPKIQPDKAAKITVLGENQTPLKWNNASETVEVSIPQSLRSKLSKTPAWVIKIK